MKCLVTTISILLPSVLFCFFISPSVFAVNDVTGTIDSNMANLSYLCTPDNSVDTPHCSDFKYLIIEPASTNPYSKSSYLALYISNDSSFFRFPRFVSFTLDLTPSAFSSYGVRVSTSTIGTDSWSYTLTDKDMSFGGSAPSGSLSITQNGTYDVTDYAEAVVDVPTPDPEVIQGDYHDDLVNIQHAILLCGGVILVLYFFYCIYRMIIKPMGGF